MLKRDTRFDVAALSAIFLAAGVLAFALPTGEGLVLLAFVFAIFGAFAIAWTSSS